MSDPTYGQPQWQQPQPPAVPGQQPPAQAYPPQPGAWPPAPQQMPYPPQVGYPQQPQMGYPQQPYGQPPINVNVQQNGPGRSVTRAHIGVGFHFFHITMTFCTGGIWGVVYAIQWYKRSRPITVTTHER